MIKTLVFNLSEIIPYINWTYFFFAWKIDATLSSVINIPKDKRNLWIKSLPQRLQGQAKEAALLYDEASYLLQNELSGHRTLARFGLFPAKSEMDNIYILNSQEQSICIPCLRQQHYSEQGPNLCLSDFINPDKDYIDTIGIFVATVKSAPSIMKNDKEPYKDLITQVLYDRFAEATCERMHELVRKKYWGYVPNENLKIKELHIEKFQGIRPAIGYPSLPDQSVNFIINDILHFSDLGIQLTENGAMLPHATVCGLMISHPKAHYFSIGEIAKDQLEDYAKRRGFSTEVAKKFLGANIYNI